ncbi:MAG: S9 family peptidase, partial [Planctomycetota bacterium]|nr:S9 family peptidase [Planctomycetota bacterium]
MNSRVGLNRSRAFCFRPALAAALALLFLSLPLAAEETWTPKHLAKLRSVVSAKVSPDGKSIAYLLAIPRELMKEDSGSSWVELHVLKDGRHIPFITGKVSISTIRWTPDGQSISFLNKKDGDKARSLYLIPVNGGESRKAFDSKLSVSSYAWSPDGKRVAFLSSSELEEDKEKKKFKDKGFAPIIYEEEWKPSRVWLVDVNADGSGEPKALELPGSASSLSWSPDGSRLLVALAPTSLVDDYYMNRRLRV